MSKERSGCLGGFRGERLRDSLSSPLGLLKFEVQGKENLDFLKDGSSAIIAFFPHTGHLDSLAVRRAFPPDLRSHLIYPAAANYWYQGWRSGLSSLLLRTFPMERKDSGKKIMGGLSATESLLRSGYLIVISPEGTRSSLPEEERVFHTGIAELVLRTGLSVVPVRLRGFEEIMPKGSSLPRLLDGYQRRSVSVSFGEPITFDPETIPGVRAQQRKFITAKIREVLLTR